MFGRDGKRPQLAIFNPHAPTCLAFVRSLGRNEIPFCVYGHRKVPVSRLSKYVRHYERCPDPSNYVEFDTWLKGKLRSEEIRLIAPTSDVINYYIADNTEFFPSEIRDRLPDRDKTISVLFKDRFHEACVKAGLTMPWTMSPSTEDEALAEADNIPYPVILKPKSHVVAGLYRGMTAHNPEQLRKEFKAYEVVESLRPLFDRYPDHRLPMLQEKIVAPEKDFVGISGLLDTEGKAIVSSAVSKNGQWPPGVGIGTSFKSYTGQEVIEKGVSMTQTLLGRGIFEIELVYDRKRQCHIPIDLNPRAFGQIALDIARGNDIPALWYQIMMGEEVAVQPPPAEDVEWLHGVLRTLEQIYLLRIGPGRIERLGTIAKTIRDPHVNVVFDKRDPLPLVRELFSLARHPRALISPLWEKFD